VDDALATGIACLSPAVCVVVDDRGRVVVGTR
jgi:hypothetical protein